METIKKLVKLAGIFLGGILLNYFMLFITTVIITAFDRTPLNIEILSPFYVVFSILYSLVYVYAYTKETKLIEYKFEENEEKNPFKLRVERENNHELY